AKALMSVRPTPKRVAAVIGRPTLSASRSSAPRSRAGFDVLSCHEGNGDENYDDRLSAAADGDCAVSAADCRSSRGRVPASRQEPYLLPTGTGYRIGNLQADRGAVESSQD